MPTEDIVERLARALSPRVEVLEAYLFGSQALGRSQPHSDVDVAVYLAPGQIDDSGLGYVSALSASLQQALGRSDVDLVVLNDAPPVLYHRVLRDGVRVTARDLRATTTREGQALSRYCDYQPQLEKIEAAQRRRLESGQFGR
jgi:uncharacterized protein